MSDERLLPCPFCGATALTFDKREVSWNADKGTIRRIVAVCGGCGAQGPGFGYMSFTGERTATIYWNRRAPLPAVPDVDIAELLERLRYWVVEDRAASSGTSEDATLMEAVANTLEREHTARKVLAAGLKAAVRGLRVEARHALFQTTSVHSWPIWARSTGNDSDLAAIRKALSLIQEKV